MRLLSTLILALSALILGTSAVTTTFKNQNAYIFDTDGNAIDSTSGKVHVINGLYVWYGISLGCGKKFCGIYAWSSTDLQSWQNEGLLFDYTAPANQAICTLNGNCGRPHVLYNAASKKYILWVNAGSPGYQIYTSDNPYSGFTAVADRALIGFQPAGTSGGDFTIENINGTGYLVYSSIDFKTVGASIWPPFNQTLFVQELTADFMNTTGAAYHVLTKGDYVDYEAESPDLFYRNGYYYITASDTCGFCTGTLLILYRSRSITGPWKRQILSADTCGGQTTGVIPITGSSGSITYLHQADLFSTAPFSGIRSSDHGFQFQPLSFNNDGSANDLNCASSATFKVDVGRTSTSSQNKGLIAQSTDLSPQGSTYTQHCDLGQGQYYQTWTASKSGTLKEVGVNFNAIAPTGPTTVTVFRFPSIAELQAPHYIWETLGSATFTAANLSFSLENRVVTPNAAVKAGDKLGFAVVTTAIVPLCYLQTAPTSKSHVLLYNGADQVSYRGAQGKTSPVVIQSGLELKWFSIVE